MPTEIMPYLQHLSYFGIFLMLALLDVLIPLPEEIILIMVGYTVYFGTLDPTLTILVAIAAFVAGDNATFWLSMGGNRLIAKFTTKKATPLLERYSEKMRTHAGLTMLIMTFVPSIRFFAPIVAGSVRTPWKVFILFDLLAVALYASLYLLAGYFFHSQIKGVIQEFELIGHLMIYVLLLVIGVALGLFMKKQERKG